MSSRDRAFRRDRTSDEPIATGIDVVTIDRDGRPTIRGKVFSAYTGQTWGGPSVSSVPGKSAEERARAAERLEFMGERMSIEELGNLPVHAVVVVETDQGHAIWAHRGRGQFGNGLRGGVATAVSLSALVIRSVWSPAR